MLTVRIGERTADRWFRCGAYAECVQALEAEKTSVHTVNDTLKRTNILACRTMLYTVEQATDGQIRQNMHQIRELQTLIQGYPSRPIFALCCLSLSINTTLLSLRQCKTLAELCALGRSQYTELSESLQRFHRLLCKESDICDGDQDILCAAQCIQTAVNNSPPDVDDVDVSSVNICIVHAMVALMLLRATYEGDQSAAVDELVKCLDFASKANLNSKTSYVKLKTALSMDKRGCPPQPINDTDPGILLSMCEMRAWSALINSKVQEAHIYCVEGLHIKPSCTLFTIRALCDIQQGSLVSALSILRSALEMAEPHMGLNILYNIAITLMRMSEYATASVVLQRLANLCREGGIKSADSGRMVVCLNTKSSNHILARNSLRSATVRLINLQGDMCPTPFSIYDVEYLQFLCGIKNNLWIDAERHLPSGPVLTESNLLPGRARRLLLRIWTTLHLSRWNESLALSDELLHVAPNDACVLIYKSEAALRLGQWETSLACASTALKCLKDADMDHIERKRPKLDSVGDHVPIPASAADRSMLTSWALNNRGLVEMSKGEQETALASFSEACKNYRGNADAVYNHTLLSIVFGAYASAAKNWQRFRESQQISCNEIANCEYFVPRQSIPQQHIASLDKILGVSI